MKLVVIVPGFGDPEWDAKVEILRSNMAAVASHFDDYLFHIVQYTQDKRLPQDLLESPHIRVVYDRGVLGRNIVVHAPPSVADTADYVMVLLDDVQLVTPFPWSLTLELMTDLQLDVVSPSLPHPTMSYWAFMLQSKNSEIVAELVTRCELFCYLMTPAAYARYYTFCDAENPWMWGMDFMLHSHMKLRVALLHKAQMIHVFPRVEGQYSSHTCPRKDANTYLAKYGTSWDELHALPTTLARVVLED